MPPVWPPLHPPGPTIFALYNRPLHTINPSPCPGALCLEGRVRLGRALVLRGVGGAAPRVGPQRVLVSDWEPVSVILLGVGGTLENWIPGLWPPRERAHSREVRGPPPSFLHEPQRSFWPQAATVRALGAPGALALSLPGLSFTGQCPEACKACYRPGAAPSSLAWDPAQCLPWAQGVGWALAAALPAQ